MYHLARQLSKSTLWDSRFSVNVRKSVQEQQTKPGSEKKIEGTARDKWASLIAFLAIDKGICSMLAVIKYELAANGESRISKQPPAPRQTCSFSCQN